jgi:hypothetical protein
VPVVYTPEELPITAVPTEITEPLTVPTAYTLGLYNPYALATRVEPIVYEVEFIVPVVYTQEELPITDVPTDTTDPLTVPVVYRPEELAIVAVPTVCDAELTVPV